MIAWEIEDIIKESKEKSTSIENFQTLVSKIRKMKINKGKDLLQNHINVIHYIDKKFRQGCDHHQCI